MIPFNKPYLTGKEAHYMYQAVYGGKLSGNGIFTKKCQEYFEKQYGFKKSLLTTSCTDALEMCAILADIQPGDEVIVPSYTFVSTALAFVRQGAKIVFADSCPDNPNIDTTRIEELITPKTKAIVPVHYAGVSCEMDTIMAIAQKYDLKVIEDAAQGIMSTYKGKPLGTIGDYGCFSFHETKNISMGEGGALLIANPADIETAEIVREKGTNRSKFFRGEIDKYSWVEAGSSYLPSELNAAYLWGELESAEEIYKNRMDTWQYYHSQLENMEKNGKIKRPVIPENCVHNAHMYYIKAKDLDERTRLLAYLKENGVSAVFHYIPLHSAAAGIKYGRFFGEDQYTTKESERLLRLPLYYGMKEEDREKVVRCVEAFYK